MKTLILLISFFVCMGLSARNTAAVSGNVVEKSTKEPMEFVNVGLFRSDSSLVKGTVTDKDGNYNFNALAKGKYYIEISFIGFKTITTPVFTLEDAQKMNLGMQGIEVSEKILGEIDIIEEKSVFENGIDRKIYNVDKDLNSVSGSASSVLENIPSVTVDINGQVSLLGSSNVTILINGKPSPLMRRNSATALQQIPANTIERIEIITNPSAKYKPDGAVGIINIVLKKNTKAGLNGTLTANGGNDERFNTSLLFNYKPGKLNLYGSYAYRQDYRSRKMTDLRTSFDSLGNESSEQDLVSNTWYKPFTHMATLGFDWMIDSANEIGISGVYDYLGLSRADLTTTVIRDPFEVISSDYDRELDNNEFEWEMGFDSYWTHKFRKEDHELSFEFNGVDLFEFEDNKNKTVYRTPLLANTYDNTIIQLREKQFEGLVEYINPVGEDQELEAGYSLEYIGQEFDFYTENFDPVQNIFVKDDNKSNLFNCTQAIHALYTTYSFDIEDFGVMLGLRAEQTFITSELLTFDSLVPNDYFRVYPTLHLSWEFDDYQSMQLSYSRRINRPDGDELNPFPEYTDPRNIEAGNPLLLPEQSHSIQFGYMLKNKTITFVPTLYYKYNFDAFTEVTKYVNDTVLLTTFDNLASEQNAGLELIFSTKIKKFMNINLSGTAYYNQIDASNLGYSGNRSIFSWDSKLAVNIMPWKYGMIQLNANYRSERLTSQGVNLPSFGLNAGYRQDIFKQRASLVLNVSDVFNTMRWASEIDTPELKQVVTSKRKSQIVYIGFSWRFGRVLKVQNEDLKFDEKM